MQQLSATDAVPLQSKATDAVPLRRLTATDAVPLKRLTATLRDGSQIVWYNAADENKAMAACALDGDVEPVGSVVWPAGVAAISALARLSHARRGGLRGLSILELGAGTGLKALVAAKFGARVVATDASELCLRLLRAACDANPDLSFMVEKLDFSDVAAVEALVRARGPFDVVVACDTFYSTALAKATAGAIAASQATARLVLDPCRLTRPQFVDELKRLEVASWDGGADVAFRPLPVDAGAVRFDGDDASDAPTFSFDGCYAAGFGQLPPGPLFRCCIS